MITRLPSSLLLISNPIALTIAVLSCYGEVMAGLNSRVHPFTPSLIDSR